MVSQQEHPFDPILPCVFPPILHIHNLLNKETLTIPDFLPSSAHIGHPDLPEYRISHIPMLLATALKWSGFRHEAPDYECRLDSESHAMAGNISFHTYQAWLVSLYGFFSIPFEGPRLRKQRLQECKLPLPLLKLYPLIAFNSQ